MMPIPMSYGLMLAGLLFVIGFAGVLMRRNLIVMLVSIEIMLNASGLAFIAAGSRWNQADGQVMFLFILAMAAAEVSVGLALIIQFHHHKKSLDSDKADSMRG
jgi:NADH-quinone oxidoreductase subunit K